MVVVFPQANVFKIFFSDSNSQLITRRGRSQEVKSVQDTTTYSVNG